MKAINQIIDLHIYPFQIMVSINQTDRQLKNTLKKYDMDPEDDKILTLGSENTEVGRVVLYNSGRIIMRVNFYPKDASQFGTLQHEIFHCAEFILDLIGMKLTHDSDEAYAYLIGFLTEKIYKLLKYE